MKKQSVLLLTLLLLFSLLGCPAENRPSTPPTAPTEATVSVGSGGPAPESTFSVHFIDVGQADAALVECDGQYMLIDGGNRGDSSRLYTILKREGVSTLELVVGTHAHEDHIGGIPGALSWASAETVLCPVSSFESEAFEDFARYAERFGGGITIPEAGDAYALGSAAVTVLGLNQGSSVNDSSIVLRIDYGRTSFLFTGDAEWEAEQALLDSGAELCATVLKVGHHGSDTSTGYAFLRRVHPAYAVISCGAGNAYGHPTETVLSRLRDAEVQVFRTDLQGDIFCSSDGETVTFRVSQALDPTELPGTQEPTIPQPSEPGQGRYILNIRSMKFHLPDCSSVTQMAARNRKEVVCTREELLTQGYSPCGRCHP